MRRKENEKCGRETIFRRISALDILGCAVISLVFATRNGHKTAEVRALLGGEFAIEDLSRYPAITEPVEDGKSFADNAAIKALAASRELPGEWVVADDSGLEVEALNGAPGIFSARYAGKTASDEANVRKLLAELEKVSCVSRNARFRCVLVLARDSEIRATCEGCVLGTIARTATGTHGFGYDPIFVPDGYDRTFADLPATTKNEISHRGRAVAELRKVLLNLR